MGVAAIPIVAAVIGAGGSIAATKLSADAQKRAAKKAYDASKPKFALPDAQRAALLQSLYSMAGGGPGAAQLGAPGQGGIGAPQQEDSNRFIRDLLERLGSPSASYQGFLEALQERRDARAGVPVVPPQGPADPSAQRQSAATAGQRSY